MEAAVTTLAVLREGFAELLAPTRCAGCEYPGVLLCPRCDQRLERIAPLRACPRCGAPECARRCHECAGREFAFESARCAVVFEGAAPRIVVLHKDASERRLSAVMARRMAEALGDWTEWADAVVGVPASLHAVSRRGYDHGADLAAALAAEAGLGAQRPLRCLTSRDQRGLTRAERAANVGFTCEPQAPSGRPRLGATPARPASLLPPARVLLVDDVFTTGATTDAAARALIEAGSEAVRVVAFARVLRS
jgi:predicted amidophosphoribosyltransferase